ncbi:MAG: tetratricopeptide repeat protein [Prolixibacteraceae bacterium]|nr:tetratricopeptide repeat protein [Prolixibacteraceae bacterium]
MQKEKFYKLLRNPVLLGKETLPELQKITEDYPYFHAAVFLLLKNLHLSGSPGFTETLKRSAIGIPDRKRLYMYLHSLRESAGGDYYFEQTDSKIRQTIADDKSNQVPENNLIDKFLSHEPRGIKIEKDSQVKVSEKNEIVEKSLAETDELITETLAMIYFQQKKYEKALDAFKKLSLKYPEKSVYFASRIEEIEKLKRL